MFGQKDAGHDDEQPRGIKVKAAAWSRLIGWGEILLTQHKQERAPNHRPHSHREDRVRRAQDFHIHSVSIVPPIVERSRNEHGERAPNRHPCAKGTTKTPEPDRARLLSAILAEARNCRLTPPEGGMFVMLDVRGTGLSSEAFAHELLSQERVAVLPCDSFGPSAAGHLRISLTAPEPRLAEAGRRIIRFADTLT